MPLTRNSFSEADAHGFVAGKERLWAEYGYGLQTFSAEGPLVG